VEPPLDELPVGGSHLPSVSTSPGQHRQQTLSQLGFPPSWMQQFPLLAPLDDPVLDPVVDPVLDPLLELPELVLLLLPVVWPPSPASTVGM
jgi:hypothetical protein